MGRHAHNGICRQYQAYPHWNHLKHPEAYLEFVTTRNWCAWCERHIIYDGIMCPCCHHQLRYSRKTGPVKRRIEEARHAISERPAADHKPRSRDDARGISKEKLERYTRECLNDPINKIVFERLDQI